MSKEYCIYKHMNKDNECIYVGLTDNMNRRQSEHKRSTVHYNDVSYILYAQCENKTAMIIYEQYYINKLNPIYNKADKREDTVHGLVGIMELVFTVYTFPVTGAQQVVTKKAIEAIARMNKIKKFVESYTNKSIAGEVITLHKVPNKDVQSFARSVRLRNLFFEGTLAHNDKTTTIIFSLDHLIRGLSMHSHVQENILRGESTNA